MFNQNGFAGKRILVTGASSGIGRSIAILLDSLGARLMLVGRSEEKLQETLSRMEHGNHEAFAFDLCNFEGYEEFIQRLSEGGKFDGMVHCAGIAKAVPLKVMTPKAIKEMMDIHFVAFMMLVKYMSKKRYTNDGASLVGMSAVNAHHPQRCMSAYAASKAAVEAAVRCLAEELYTGRKIRINALIVGPVVTPMSGFDMEDLSAVGTMSEVTPNLMGMAAPLDIAKMAVCLLDDVSSYVTGRNYYVDGGRL